MLYKNHKLHRGKWLLIFQIFNRNEMVCFIKFQSDFLKTVLGIEFKNSMERKGNSDTAAYVRNTDCNHLSVSTIKPEGVCTAYCMRNRN